MAGIVAWRFDIASTWDESTRNGDEQADSEADHPSPSDHRRGGGAPSLRGGLEPEPPIADSEEVERSAYDLGPLRIFGVATALGIFSALQAYNYVNLLTNREQPLYLLLALNVSYW